MISLQSPSSKDNLNISAINKPTVVEPNKFISTFKSATQSDVKMEGIYVRDTNAQLALKHFTENIKRAILERKEADREKAVNQLQRFTKSRGQELGECLELLANKIKSAPATFNVPSKALSAFQSDYLLNKRETGEDRVSYNRCLFEDTVFHLNGFSSIEAVKNYMCKAPGSTPTYGSLAFNPGRGGADIYGETALYFNADIKKNMTFTACDSGSIGATWIDEPMKIKDYVAVLENIYPVIANASRAQIFAIYKDNALPNDMYVEWQSHGALNFKTDIDYLTYNKHDKDADLDAIAEFAQKHNLPIKYN